MEVEHHKNHQHLSNTDTDSPSPHNSNNLHHNFPPRNTHFTQSSESIEYHKQVIRSVFGESSSESELEDENSDSVSYSDHLDEYQKQMVKDVFGDSSSESEGGEDYRNPSRHWSKVDEITGLWLCSRFLSPPQQSTLLRCIEDEGWFNDGAQNQAMRFGDLPSWADDLSSAIHEVVRTGDTCVSTSHLLSRNPFFDQLIVNVYQPGEGICAHVDLARFEDGIAIVSLESHCVMHFSRVGKDEDIPLATKIPVYLIPGSLVVMCGEARYNWKHEINRKPGFQIWEGREIVQKKRTSITLRKLCVSE